MARSSWLDREGFLVTAIEEVYLKYRHLDELLSSDSQEFKDQVRRDIWVAIKSDLGVVGTQSKLF